MTSLQDALDRMSKDLGRVKTFREYFILAGMAFLGQNPYRFPGVTKRMLSWLYPTVRTVSQLHSFV